MRSATRVNTPTDLKRLEERVTLLSAGATLSYAESSALLALLDLSSVSSEYLVLPADEEEDEDADDEDDDLDDDEDEDDDDLDDDDFEDEFDLDEDELDDDLDDDLVDLDDEYDTDDIDRHKPGHTRYDD